MGKQYNNHMKLGLKKIEYKWFTYILGAIFAIIIMDILTRNVQSPIIHKMFHVVTEKNIPSLFSTLQLMLSGTLLYSTYRLCCEKMWMKKHHVYWKYLSFIDASAAIELYNSNPNRILKFGISDAHTYYWIHSMNSIGQYRSNVTADWPIAASFDNLGQITYAAHNYTEEEMIVNFSDGYQLTVPAGEMSTNRGESITGTIQTDFNQAYINGSIIINFSSDSLNPGYLFSIKGKLETNVESVSV